MTKEPLTVTRYVNGDRIRYEQLKSVVLNAALYSSIEQSIRNVKSRRALTHPATDSHMQTAT